MQGYRLKFILFVRFRSMGFKSQVLRDFFIPAGDPFQIVSGWTAISSSSRHSVPGPAVRPAARGHPHGLPSAPLSCPAAVPPGAHRWRSGGPPARAAAVPPHAAGAHLPAGGYARPPPHAAPPARFPVRPPCSGRRRAPGRPVQCRRRPARHGVSPLGRDSCSVSCT